MANTIFPDTMIATQIGDELKPQFVESLWEQDFIRKQIETDARTTSGIHKINQKVIQNIQIPVPPTKLQEEFETMLRDYNSISNNKWSLPVSLSTSFRHFCTGHSEVSSEPEVPKMIRPVRGSLPSPALDALRTPLADGKVRNCYFMRRYKTRWSYSCHVNTGVAHIVHLNSSCRYT